MRPAETVIRRQAYFGATVSVGLVAVAILIVVLRRVDLLLAPQFWAEDAVVFFAEAEQRGVATLGSPFAGYFYLFPRAVALAGTQAPIRYLPMVYSVAALFFAALALWFVSRSTLSSHRFVLAGMVIATALAPYSDEVWGNLANCHWFSALAMIAACSPPRSQAHAVQQLVALPLFAFTGPSALVVLPAAAVAVRWRRDPWRYLTFGVIAAGAVATAWTMVAYPRQHGPETLFDRAGYVLSAIRGRHSMQVMALAAAAVSFVTWWAWRAKDLTVTAYGVTTLCFAVAFCVSAPSEALFAIPHAAGRYVFVPWTMVVWILWAMASSWRLVWTLLAAAIVAAAATPQLAFRARPDVDWQKYSQCLESRPNCVVKVTPYRDPVMLPGRGQR